MSSYYNPANHKRTIHLEPPHPHILNLTAKEKCALLEEMKHYAKDHDIINEDYASVLYTLCKRVGIVVPPFEEWMEKINARLRIRKNKK